MAKRTPKTQAMTNMRDGPDCSIPFPFTLLSPRLSTTPDQETRPSGAKIHQCALLPGLKHRIL